MAHDPLKGSMQDFRLLAGAQLLDRVQPFFDWQQARREAGYWPLGRSLEVGPQSVCCVRSDTGVLFEGVNLASQDYLGLSAHPAVKLAGVDALLRFGVHSAGSAALVGNTALSLRLESRLGEFLGQPFVTLFPTGWAAGFGVIRALIGPQDHVVMDRLAHACLQEGARAATGSIHTFAHNDLLSLRERLMQLRAGDALNGILVVTESLFSMDSDSPDLRAMQLLAHEFEATLLVDVAHDLGCMGEGGRGLAGDQGMLGELDIVIGSFSKTFAANGGFVACRRRSVKEYLRYYSSPHTFSNALSPVQAAVVTGCLEIVESAEGSGLRQRLMSNILTLRQRLAARQLQTYGKASPIVCVKLGGEALARRVGRLLPERGVVANIVEFPAVARDAARVRLQVMASHQPADLAYVASQLAEAVQQAESQA